MNPACVFVRPKLALPNMFWPCSVRTFGRLSTLMTSILNCPVLVPPSLMFLMNEASTLACRGVRTSVIVRGALPNVPAGAGVNAGGIQPGRGRMIGRGEPIVEIAFGLERRAGKVGPVRVLAAEPRVGRLLDVDWETALKAHRRQTQSSRRRIASATRPCAHCFPVPNGSSKIGAMFSRCGTSTIP